MDSSKRVSQSNPAAWERGCRADLVRNEFVIPEITKILEEFRPETILDIGSATGYVPRSIAAQLTFAPKWALLDSDEERLRLAVELWGDDPKMSVICGDVIAGEVPKAPFDVVLVTFTLLEIGDLQSAIQAIAKSTVVDGLAVVAQPDVWRDALAQPDRGATISALLTDGVEIEKLDRFTGTAYPFFAVRIELVIAEFLRQGFALRRLAHREPEGEIFLLTFQKLIDHSLQTRPQ